MSSVVPNVDANWETPTLPPSSNGWECLAEVTPDSKSRSPTLTTHPSLPEPSPVVSQCSETLSPMPSLNAIPDPEWASWGTDLSRIKKEEDQVKRPNPTHARPPPPSLVNRNPALAAGVHRNGSSSAITSPPSHPHSTSPAHYSVRQQSAYSALKTPFNDNTNMRQPHIPVTYSTRPTFQYGKPASTIAVPAIIPALPTDSALDFTPPQLQTSTSGHANQTSPPQSSSAGIGAWKIKTEASACNHVSSNNGDNDVESAVEPLSYDHIDILGSSTGADSGHASSIEAPSTIIASSVVCTAPNVNLPHLEQKNLQFLDLSKQSSSISVHPKVHLLPTQTQVLQSAQPTEQFERDQPSEKQSSQKILSVKPITKFKLSIPKTLSIPKALLAVDFESLVLLGGKKVQVDVGLASRTIEFEVKADTAANHKHAIFLVNIALDEFKSACAPALYEVEDIATREMLKLKGEENPLKAKITIQENEPSSHIQAHDDLPSLDASNNENPQEGSISNFSSDATVNENQTNALMLLLSMSGPTSAASPARTETETSAIENTAQAASPFTQIPAFTPLDEPTSTLSSQSPFSVAYGRDEKSGMISFEGQNTPLQSKTVTPTQHHWIKRCKRQAGVYNICLPLPDYMKQKIGGYCGLEERIPIWETKWFPPKNLFILNDTNIEKLLFAREVLLVVVYVVFPAFSPYNPIVRLEEGTSAHDLAQELRRDKRNPLSGLEIDKLTIYVIQRLRNMEDSPTIGLSAAADSPPPSQVPLISSSHSRQPSAETEQANTQSSGLKVNLPPSVAKSEALARPEVSSIKLEDLEVQLDDRQSAEAAKINSKNALDLAQFHIRESEAVVTENNSISWYLPEGPSRCRYTGKGAKYLKTIRRATGISNLFWRHEASPGTGWFIILLASSKQDVTEDQRRKLAYALRICKSWAIAVFAPDMLALPEDLPESLRDDPMFRLDEFEFGEAWQISTTLRCLSSIDNAPRYEAALARLVDACRRPHAYNRSPRLLHPRFMWPGVFSELCTQYNSICWTIDGLQQVNRFGGQDFEHLRGIENMSGIVAIKFDNNERRYGKNRCRVYILASMSATPTEKENRALLKSFRLVLAAMKVFGFVSLLPTDANMCASSIATEAVKLASKDDAILATLTDALAHATIAYQGLQNIASHLFDNGQEFSTSRVFSTNKAVSTSTSSSVTSAVTSVRTAPYEGYRSLRDIPEFAWTYPVDDGLMKPLDEESFEETTPDWAQLDYTQRMSLIGSACWAMECIKPLLSRNKSASSEPTSIGPSASQVGGSSSDTTVSHASPIARPRSIDYSGWESARDQVVAADDLQPRVQNWVKEIPHGRPFIGELGRGTESSNKPIATSHLEGEWIGNRNAAPAFKIDIFTVELNMPSDRKLRMAILGENHCILRQIGIHTGAEVTLAPLQAGQQEWERLIQITGQARSVNRAIQMSKTAVFTHVPSWRFSSEVESIIHRLKAVEIQKLATSSQDISERWNIGHLTFIPKESISCVNDAIKSGAFVKSCATLHLDSVVEGKINIDAPTVDQADAALIQLCDLIRRLVPGWLPESGVAREIIEAADKLAGPLIQRQASQIDTPHSSQEPLPQLNPAELGWRVNSKVKPASRLNPSALLFRPPTFSTIAATSTSQI